MDFPPESNEIDITKRYRHGYNALRNFDLDVIAFMEDDDWYSYTYLQTMVEAWIKHGRPELFGTSITMYYNIRVFGYFPMNHHTQSHAMSTLIKPDLSFDWCPDNEAFTDTFLWAAAVNNQTGKLLTRVIFTPPLYICLGIKHGIGKTGGRSHVDRLDRYSTNTGKRDINLDFLRSVVDEESFELYRNIFANEKQI